MDSDSEIGVECFGFEPLPKSLERRVNRNIDRIETLLEELFLVKSRYNIIILTFTYRADLRPFDNLDQLRLDRDAFFYYAYTNEYMRRIEGYIWKIEYGINNGGLHMHVILFYDGSIREDITYAELVGQYWEQITGGRGTFYNSNKYKKHYARGPYGDVTGRIDRNNRDKRERFNDYLVNYIAKSEQQVPFRMNPYIRLFGTSQAR